MAGKLSGDGDMREGALRNKNLYNFIFPLSTVGWSGSGMGVGRGRPKLLRWGEGGRCAIKLCTILFFRARRHDKAGGVLRRSPLKRPRRAMPRTARSAVLGSSQTRPMTRMHCPRRGPGSHHRLLVLRASSEACVLARHEQPSSAPSRGLSRLSAASASGGTRRAATGPVRSCRP